MAIPMMRVLERAHAGWKIRRERHWWNWVQPIQFRWQRPSGRRENLLSESELKEMRKLGRAKTLVPIGANDCADPPYHLIGLPGDA